MEGERLVHGIEERGSRIHEREKDVCVCGCCGGCRSGAAAAEDDARKRDTHRRRSLAPPPPHGYAPSIHTDTETGKGDERRSDSAVRQPCADQRYFAHALLVDFSSVEHELPVLLILAGDPALLLLLLLQPADSLCLLPLVTSATDRDEDRDRQAFFPVDRTASVVSDVRILRFA